MRTARFVVWADQKLHKAFGGRVSLVALAGLPSLRLTTTGRKSGLPRSTNLLYYPRGDGFVLTASNWGRPHDPAWAHNLRANPKCAVALAGKPVDVVARELHGEEYELMWAELLAFWPGYAMEQREAARRLPVFVLARVAR
ncbi:MULTISPECIES: nitroreductase family deazaflavin-dependent oxidoreductase [unclassified Amycolatopsis]|uniref:nitroreductase family deazaflavin-dependent oxidoreductase n=1 Tax=unclassified Amycolatopsis TaxID=2618356 RepID=UPI002874A467|nr:MULTISPECIES: nitroreductase family deazaflavin-dependent oxidoreductase [unclassified Amycolatopsis]MDS0137020.1 nitroreductase family deazaflavin-dependent oxidoreductase [Amycolatopsis sp. 505]MDS0143685.1 nitroreductase family deazaflavin-dependent oxidoreductase [Amycolatopsis sp. CM201R]